MSDVKISFRLDSTFSFTINGRIYLESGQEVERPLTDSISVMINYSGLEYPPFILFTDYNHWIIAKSISPNRIEVLQESTTNVPNYGILNYKYLDPSDLPRTVLLNYFKRYNSYPPDPNAIQIRQLYRKHRPLTDSGFEIIYPETPIDPIYHESYEDLLRQTYNFPQEKFLYLTINGKQVPFISYDQLQNMLHYTQVETFETNPILQPFGGSNILRTVYDKNGHMYLVKLP